MSFDRQPADRYALVPKCACFVVNVVGGELIHPHGADVLRGDDAVGIVVIPR